MSRDSVASVTSAAVSPQVRYRILVEISSLASGTLRATTGGNFVMAGANTYSPIGGFGGIETVQEELSMFPRAVRAWLAAVNTGQIADAINENLFNKPLKAYRCFLDDNLAVVGTPQLLWGGRISRYSLKTGDPQRGNYYEVEAENRLVQASKAAYLNRDTLRTVFGSSGDTFFDYIALIPLRSAPWGNKDYNILGQNMQGQWNASDYSSYWY